MAKKQARQAISKEQKWFGIGTVTGFVILSIALAAVPKRGRITDDTAIYQNMSEINVQRESAVNFDKDIKRLSHIEPHYRENLSLARNARLQAPLQRVAKRKYRYSGSVSDPH